MTTVLHPTISKGYSQPVVNRKVDFLPGCVLTLDDAYIDTERGKWYDPSLGNNTGSIIGATRNGDPGMYFDGIDDYVDCGSGDSLDFTGGVTITTWLKTTVEEVSMIISKYASMPEDSGWMISINEEGKPGLSGRDMTGNYHNSGWGQKINDGVWHHVVGAREGSVWKIYVDNVLGSSNDVGTSGHLICSTNLVIAFLSYHLEGSIAGVRIYNRALAQWERTLLYNQTKIRYGL